MSNQGLNFQPTPHETAAKFWKEKSVKAPNLGEKNHCLERAKECEELASMEAELKTAPAASTETDAHECDCGRQFKIAAHLAKHRKSCELVKLLDEKDPA